MIDQRLFWTIFFAILCAGPIATFLGWMIYLLLLTKLSLVS